MAGRPPSSSDPGGVGRDITDFLMGGVSAMFASIFTNPLEVAKTRMQLQGELKQKGSHQVHYRNVLHALYVIGRKDGLVALERGLPAMMGFQFFLNIFRLGTFRISERRGLTKDSTGRISLWRGAFAAGVGGAVGSFFGAPFYLAKTRLQAVATKGIAVGHQHVHVSTSGAFRDIYNKEGIKGLFRGASPQIGRGAVGSSTQILCFTAAKEKLRERGMFANHPLALSFVGANLGGLVMTMFANPFDVVATRLSNQPVDAKHRGKLYSGMADCFIKMVRSEGFLSLYKGVGAHYARLGPHTVLLLVCWDALLILEKQLRARYT